MERVPQYLVLDGGLATEIAWAHGHTYIDGDPLWSARLLTTHPDVLKKVHTSFLDAGADVIETASYQASVTGFIEHLGVSELRASELIKLSGQLACSARDDFWNTAKSHSSDRCYPLVAGSLGPYGACQHDASEYTGNYVDTMSAEVLMSWHRPQVAALVESGVDLLAFDTIPAQKEAEAIVALLLEFPAVQAWISFSCKDEHHTCHGETLVEAVSAVSPSKQVVGVGINCSRPCHVTALLGTVPADVRAHKRLIVYPNSGEAWIDKHWVGTPDTRTLDHYVPAWLDAGANWIGGCCRVTPADISKIRSALHTHLKSCVKSGADTV